MVYKLIIKTLAEQDITESVEYYSINAPHRIADFLTEISSAINLLKHNPEHFQKRYGDVRVINIKTFPFSLYYTIEDNIIFVHAVLHTSRDPLTGIGRI